ncbi:hypothetical protein P175DRAFT_0429094 [Aspergillus ochraceoroseus IBT 24754]|uniref:Glutathione S-transferase n=1 Tax=Aspergillus ochraceoroseus IBT 24754 TaxID=1392256 RepID=A0A2T5MA55_9EURO|nr:uncharacterized protein P175DRAFT_0429094 [Aspergillus ochraceoroseus IBT 24754]PTU25423.1 hypothetical protein P175DRAFT_0429094 [Aspergillus ochraceoroseus IBT 24754]
MVFGTLYTHSPNPRSATILALAKANGLELDIVYAEKKNNDGYEQLCRYNSLGQVPTFVRADGYILSECIPLTLYCTLPYSPTRDYYDILKWMSFANSDLFLAVGGVFLPLIGQRQIIRQDADDSLRFMLHRCQHLEHRLQSWQYLVGERITVADFFTASMLMGAYAAFRGEMEERFPAVTRWYDEVFSVPWFKEAVDGLPNLGLSLPDVEANGE